MWKYAIQHKFCSKIFSFSFMGPMYVSLHANSEEPGGSDLIQHHPRSNLLFYKFATLSGRLPLFLGGWVWHSRKTSFLFKLKGLLTLFSNFENSQFKIHANYLYKLRHLKSFIKSWTVMHFIMLQNSFIKVQFSKYYSYNTSSHFIA